jgi:hypothetical protein
MSSSLTRLAFVVSALVVAGCASAPQSEQARSAAAFHPAKVEVVAAQFGLFGADNAGRRMLYETDKPTVVWREEFELPVAPPTWGPGETLGIFQVSPDRKTAVTERIVPTQLGFIANEWRYASGDPVGHHKMRVYIDGQLIREFGFDIEKVPDELNPHKSPHRSDAPPGSTT